MLSFPIVCSSLCILTFVESGIVTPTSFNSFNEIYNVSFSNEWQYETILCQKSQCNIMCNVLSGCNHTYINASLSSILLIECIAQSACQQLHITSGPNITTNIECEGYNSCKDAHFNLKDTANVNLSCSSELATSFVDAACNAIILNITNSQNVIVNNGKYGSYKSNYIGVNIINSLNINCNEYYACYLNNVYCPHNSSCTVNCDSDTSLSYACYDTNIYVKDVGVDLRITCGIGNKSTTCTDLEIYCDDSSISPTAIYQYNPYTNIYSRWSCDQNTCCPQKYSGFKSCNNLENHCTIYCNEYPRQCDVYLIDGTAANSSLTVYCGLSGCTAADIRCPTASYSTCNIECEESGCSKATIHGEYTNTLNVDCSITPALNNSYSCSQSNIYCPSDKIRSCNIDCNHGEHQCWHANIYVNNDYVYNYLNLDCPETNKYYGCDSIGFNCDGTKNNTYLGTVCNAATSECSIYTCSQKSSIYCCPWEGVPDCNGINKCFINCLIDGNCFNRSINATNSTELILRCGLSQCTYSKVYCASYYCEIDCDSNSYSCNGMEIYAKNTTILHINCDYNDACNNMTIWAPNAERLSFDSRFYSSKYVTIYAEYASIIGVSCGQYKSCYYMEIYANYSKSFQLSAQYEKAWYYSTLYASSLTGWITITCISYQSNNSVCSNSNWYLPEGHNTDFVCYGRACYNLGNIYVNMSISSLFIEITECGECAGAEDCIGSFTIHCNPTTDDMYSDNTNFYNDRCDSAYCGCHTEYNGITVIEDGYSIYCPITTTVDPFDGTHDTDSSSIGLIIGGIVGSMSLIICIVIIIVIKKKNGRRSCQRGRIRRSKPSRPINSVALEKPTTSPTALGEPKHEEAPSAHPTDGQTQVEGGHTNC